MTHFLFCQKLNRDSIAMHCNLIEVWDSSCGNLLVQSGPRSGLQSGFQSRLKNNIESV